MIQARFWAILFSSLETLPSIHDVASELTSFKTSKTGGATVDTLALLSLLPGISWRQKWAAGCRLHPHWTVPGCPQARLKASFQIAKSLTCSYPFLFSELLKILELRVHSNLLPSERAWGCHVSTWLLQFRKAEKRFYSAKRLTWPKAPENMGPVSVHP